jgi:hypothetical protein
VLSKRYILIIFAIFLLGWLSHIAYSQFNQNFIVPLSNSDANGVFVDILQPKLPEAELIEKPSPHDWISQNQIHIKPDSVIIEVENPQWATFTDTNSMDPVIDANAHAIEIVPKSIDDIHVGDIISYRSSFSEGIIIHRVIKIGNDGTWYAQVKGDNLEFQDPENIRFDQIERVVVAIIY